MKKLLLLIAAIILMAACGNIKEDDIVGTWKEDTEIYKGNTAEEYVFYKTGEYSHSKDDIILEQGKYKIDGNQIKVDGKDEYTEKEKPYIVNYDSKKDIIQVNKKDYKKN